LIPLTIIIDLEPNLFRIGPFLITWHGVFAVLGILAGARLGLWLLSKDGVDVSHGADGVAWMVLVGLIGARLLYVWENFKLFAGNLGRIFLITEGGISQWGGLFGAILPFHQRLKAKLPDGVVGLTYLGLYGVGRFFLSYFRTDPAVFAGMRQAQLASLLMVALAVIAIPILLRRQSSPRGARSSGVPAPVARGGGQSAGGGAETAAAEAPAEKPAEPEVVELKPAKPEVDEPQPRRPPASSPEATPET